MLFRTATLILCFALSAPSQIIFSAGPGGELKAPDPVIPREKRRSVSGRVVNALTGEAVKKVNVRLVRAQTAGGGAGIQEDEGYSVLSGADGSFQMNSIERGQYSLSGERPGYVPGTLGSDPMQAAGSRLKLAESQSMTGILLKLTPQSVISCRVVDADGDPVGQIMVIAMRATYLERGKAGYLPSGQGQADEEGRFRIAGLLPGRYYLQAQQTFGGAPRVVSAEPGKPQIIRVQTYYPDTTSRQAASPVVVRAGEHVQDLEIRMHSAPAHHVRGRIEGQIGGHPENLQVQLVPEDADFPALFMYPLGNSVAKDRTFDLSGVTPGRYWLSLTSFDQGMVALSEINVEVGDADLDGVRMVVTRPGSLRGDIVVEGAPPAGTTNPGLSGVRIALEPEEPRRMFAYTQSEPPNSSGLFGIKGVSAGKYEVTVQGVPPGLYVKSVVYGSQDVHDRTLDLSGGASGELHVVLRYGVAQVSGSVTTQEEATGTAKKREAMVYLIPENEDDQRCETRQTDQNGNFQLENVAPGRYRLVAVERAEMSITGDAQMRAEMASRGTEVELKE